MGTTANISTNDEGSFYEFRFSFTTKTLESSGFGTEENPYQISCLEHLRRLAELVNSGDESFRSAYYVLTKTIGYDGKAFTPIGTLDNPLSAA